MSGHAAIPDGEVDAIRQWVDAVSVWVGDHEISGPFFFRAHKHLKTLLARLTVLEAENAALEAKVKAQQSHIQLHAGDCLSLDNEVNLMRSHWEEEMAENAALKAEVAEARAKAIAEERNRCAAACSEISACYAADERQAVADENAIAEAIAKSAWQAARKCRNAIRSLSTSQEETR